MTAHRTAPEPAGPVRTVTRRDVAAAVGLLALVALVALSVLWTSGSTAARGIRVAVVGTSRQASQVAASQLRTSAGGMLDPFPVADVAHARLAMQDRSADAAFLNGPKTTDELIVASAAGPNQSSFLVGRFKAYEKSQHRTLKLADGVPLPSADRRGTVVQHLTLVTLLAGALGAAALSTLIARSRGTSRIARPSRAVAACVAYPVACALVVVLTTRFAFGVLQGHEVQAVAATALLCVAAAGTVAAAQALAGRLLAGVLVLLLIVAGGLASGVALPYAFQPGPLRTAGPYLLGGAGVDLLRNIAYFHGHALGRPLLVLATWLAIGCLTTLVLSARRRQAAPDTAPKPGRAGRRRELVVAAA